MYCRIRAKCVSLMLAILIFLGGCTTTGLPKGRNTVWHLVIMGDSSLWGVGNAFATKIEQGVGVQVEVSDFALPAQSAEPVLEVLQTGRTSNFQLQELPAAVKDAEVVVMFFNPMGSVDPEKPLNINACLMSLPPSSCTPASFEMWTSDLKAIWAEIFKLRKGQPTILRAVDLDSPLISSWNRNNIFEACTECWINMSNAARLAADAYNIPFLSRYDALNGIRHTEDPVEKGYIRNDGHLSELGAEYVAELLSQMGYDPVIPP